MTIENTVLTAMASEPSMDATKATSFHVDAKIAGRHLPSLCTSTASDFASSSNWMGDGGGTSSFTAAIANVKLDNNTKKHESKAV